MTVLLSGCTTLSERVRQQAALNALQSQMNQVNRSLSEAQIALAELNANEIDSNAELDAQLKGLTKQVGRLPGTIRKACVQHANTTQNCDGDGSNTVIVNNDNKVIVGALEKVWVSPPGVAVVARMDTGAESSSVHAANLVEFERDGESWVSFDWDVDGKKIKLERAVKRYVRVYQQADTEGSRRPIVELRIRIGNLEDTFEFSLADRSHLENKFILGRNLLADVAVVDVGKQFVQPDYTEE